VVSTGQGDMKILKSAMIVLGVVAAAAVGCGDNSDDTLGGEAGSGAGGSKAGAGGTKAGSAGSKAGDGGSSAGAAGASEAGNAGMGGMGPPFDPQCEPGREPELVTPSECSFAATCAVIGCDDGVSRFGADGCLRFCDTSADCATGQRCRYTVLSVQDTCASSVLETCSIEDDGSCSCSESADCRKFDICVDEERFPASEDCAVADATCAELESLRFNLSNTELDSTASAEKVEAFEQCQEAVDARVDELGCQ